MWLHNIPGDAKWLWRFTIRAIPLLRTWHFLDFERLSFSHKTKKLDLNILYQCVLTCSWHNQNTFQLANCFHLQNFKNVRYGRDARAVTSATHVFELFKDENSWVAEVSSDCVNYMSGHIDWKYLDQASWILWLNGSLSKSKMCHVRNNGIAHQRHYNALNHLAKAINKIKCWFLLLL